MPETDKVPVQLRPYVYHKVELDWSGGKEAIGVCPFCGGDKFHVSQTNGMFDCKNCPEQGNYYTFMRRLHEESIPITHNEDLALVAEERKASVKALQQWGLVQSLVDREWMLPAYWMNAQGETAIYNLYRWPLVKLKSGQYKRRLMGTHGIDACLFGMQFWDPNKPDAYILEGVWDAIPFRQKLMQYDPGHSEFKTHDVNKSLYTVTNVVARPGSDTFKDDWIKPFIGKRVFIGGDSDYPKHNEKTGKITPPAGFTGMQMVAKKLRPVAASLHFLDWGEDGYDPLLADGFDVRDELTQ
jgi:hypothetical protein